MITISVFENIRITKPEHVDYDSFDDMYNSFTQASQNVIPIREDNILWSPAVYLATKYRNIKNVSRADVFALDADVKGNDINKSIISIDEMGISRFAHTSYRHTSEHQRFRIIFDLAEPITSDEQYKNVHGALKRWLNHTVWDANCSDFSRMYFVPCTNPQAGPCLMFPPIKGSHKLNVESLLGAFPEPVITPSPELVKLREAIKEENHENAKKFKGLYHHNIFNSTLVKREWLDEYWNLAKGYHHTGLYKFLCKVAGRASKCNYSMSVYDLAMIAAEIDSNDTGGPYYGHKKYLSHAQDAMTFVGA